MTIVSSPTHIGIIKHNPNLSLLLSLLSRWDLRVHTPLAAHQQPDFDIPDTDEATTMHNDAGAIPNLWGPNFEREDTHLLRLTRFFHYEYSQMTYDPFLKTAIPSPLQLKLIPETNQLYESALRLQYLSVV